MDNTLKTIISFINEMAINQPIMLCFLVSMCVVSFSLYILLQVIKKNDD